VLEATVEMEPVGFANHSILVDGTVAGSWSGKDNNGSGKDNTATIILFRR
jgi:hypothetical protein